MRHIAISLITLAFAAAASAHAATREDVYQAMQRCNVMNDNRVWLDCVYGAVQPMRSELHLAPAPENQVRLVPPQGTAPVMASSRPAAPAPVTHAPPKKEGFISYVLGGRKQVEMMPFQNYHFDGNGRFTVTLANGQVWRQMDDDTHVAHWKNDPARYVASIRTGSMGSSILEVKGEVSGFMVQQVR